MARLIHLNGPPGIGRTTVAALHADSNPGTPNLDVDSLHRLVGGWQDEETRSWPIVWALVRAMEATHRLIAERGGARVLGAMCDDLLAVVATRPDAVVVRSTVGAVRETCDLVAEALRETPVR